MEYCDRVIYLDLPRRVSFRRAFWRPFNGRGKTRPDLADGCPDKLDWEFLWYTLWFERTMGARTQERITASGKPVVWIRSDRDKLRYLETIQRQE